jgi:hypothetical protein
MEIASVNGIQGDSLSVPRRTERIAALEFELMPVSSGGEQKHGSHRHFNGAELPYEDVEFIEIVEDEPEVEDAAPVVPSGTHIYFIA